MRFFYRDIHPLSTYYTRNCNSSEQYSLNIAYRVDAIGRIKKFLTFNKCIVYVVCISILYTLYKYTLLVNSVYH